MARRSGPAEIPYDAKDALQDLGRNLRTARLRRNMTLEDVSSRIGIHRETLASAEKGNPAVTIGTYVAALSALGLLSGLSHLADPNADREGLALESHSARERARRSGGGMSNDF